MIVRYLSALLFVYGCLLPPLSAQDIVQTRSYPRNVFRYPLDLPPSTAGSFGELRPNHFHSGLDFRTNQHTGYPVHAVFAGFVSRLKVQYGGFGNAVYITHPNGFTSVYGHLDHFSPEIAQLVRQEQFRQKRFDVDFNLLPLQMPVYKGQVFAWSGNTGATGGPHLHFELRDTETQETINAQLFGLVIPDKVPPTISGVSIYHINGRPFDEHTPRQSLAVRGSAGHYHLLRPQVIHLSGQIGFGISAIDHSSASANRMGVYSIELIVDGKTMFTYSVERFAFDQTHAINAYIDYPYFIRTGGFIQKCFILPGSHITLYPQSVNRGLVYFNDNALHDVELVVKDVAGNTSVLKLKVQSAVPKDTPVFNPTGTLFHYDRRNELSRDGMKLIIDPGNLYDDLDFQYSASPKRAGAWSALYHLQNRYTPVHDTIEVWIKPDAALGRLADKAVVYNTYSGACSSEFADGYVKGKATTFGDFEIRIDTVPPVIRPVNIHSGSNMAKAKAILLRMSDNLSGVKSFSGSVDGDWVLVEHNYKSKILSYTFSPELKPGKHTFEFTAVDYKNNSSTYTATFYR